MNVYDFDNTIYEGDSTIDFFLYCLLKHPKIIIILPKQVFGAVLYKFKRINKKKFKEIFFSFLLELKNPEKDVREFWDKNETKIKDWYVLQQQSDDLIISASPYFLLHEICVRLNIDNLIATDVDIESGVFKSENCYGVEKQRRFFMDFPNIKIHKFYSDSISDSPMACLAEEAYLVYKAEIRKWEVG